MKTSTSGEVGRHVAVCTYPSSSNPSTLRLLCHNITASSPKFIGVLCRSVSSPRPPLPPHTEGGAVGIRVVDDGLKGESAVTINPMERMRRFMEVAGEGLRRSMEEAEKEVGVRIGCVVADAFLSCVCRNIAKEKKVKWVAIWTYATGLACTPMNLGAKLELKAVY